MRKRRCQKGPAIPLHSPWLQQTFNPPSHLSYSMGIGAEGQSGDTLAPTTPAILRPSHSLSEEGGERAVTLSYFASNCKLFFLASPLVACLPPDVQCAPFPEDPGRQGTGTDVSSAWARNSAPLP